MVNRIKPGKNMLLALLLATTCLQVSKAFALDEKYTSPQVSGSNIQAGKTLTVKDTVFFNPSLKPTILRTNSVSDFVIFRLNEFSNVSLPDSFMVNLSIKVVYTDKNNLKDSIASKTLTINYNKYSVYNSQAIFSFSGAYSMKITVLSISTSQTATSVTTEGAAPATGSILPNLQLEGEIDVNREYIMDCTNNAITSIAGDPTNITQTGELAVSWSASRVADQYDLEWTYIDQSALALGFYNNTAGQPDPNLIFKNNASRITVTGNTASIPLLYDDQGSLFYRVRSVQNGVNGELVVTAWSSDYQSSGGLGRYDYNGHARTLNWQATTSFAEEGKRKSVVQYYDGSLRQRQTVTKDNTTNTTVVAETFYDKQGRPAIQVLPAPTLSSIINYTPNFNVNINSSEYDKTYYDTLLSQGDFCSGGAPAMGVTSGASQYYSPSNPLVTTGFHQYIPDASGYAFTETQYTQDNTGRIYRQSGVGPNHQIGTGHETKYYYSNPEQTDLDALFGTEAGDAMHYQKNMVRDANGQYSVSYVDMNGKTVATALAGMTPPSLQPLNSNSHAIQTENLLNLTSNIVSGSNIISSKSMLVEYAGDQTFHYTLNAENLTLQDCQQNNICYHCLYDLNITITDNCNNQLLPGGQPVVVTKSNFQLFNIDTSCNTATPFDTTFTLYNLPEGEYNITKTLSISLQSMQYYYDSLFIPHNTCRSYNDFLQQELDSLRSRINCQQDIENNPSYLSFQDQMLADMTAPSGQYADTSLVGQGVSIFDQVEGAGYKYQQPFSPYLDENGNPDSILVIRNGVDVLLPPEGLTIPEFVSNFKPSWANSLLGYHPEYCLLQQYNQMSASLTWDDDFQNTNTYQDAITKGYLNPTGNTSQAPASQFTPILNDPLFSAYPFSSIAQQAIENSLFNYAPSSQTNGDPISLWGIASIMSECKSGDSVCALTFSQPPFLFNSKAMCTGDLDNAWRNFRSIYETIKSNWIDSYIRQQCGNTIIPSPYSAVFPVAADSMAAQGYSTGQQDKQQSDQAQAAANQQQFFTSNCQAYAAQWWIQLGPCNYTQADSMIIMPRLIQVCQQGTDVSHPYGSSSVAPSSTYQYKSFDDVITQYNDSAYGEQKNLIQCNSYLIDQPLPYNQSQIVADEPIVTKPDSCECGKINGLFTEYQNNSGQYSSFSDFIQQTLGTTMSEGLLDSLMSLCNGGSFCNFLVQPISLPPALQCGVDNACASCGLVSNYYASFTTRFPGAVPTILETDTNQQKINNLFANYMNNKLGFAKQAWEYLQFMNTCSSQSSSPYSCDELDKTLNDFNDSSTTYFNIPHFDSSGGDTTSWKADLGTDFYNDQFPWCSYYSNGNLHTDHRVDFDYYRPLCLGGGGYTFETRIMIPDSSIVPTYVNGPLRLDNYGYDVGYSLYFDQPDSIITLGLFYNHDRSLNNYYQYKQANGVSLNQWTVIKYQTKHDTLYFYVDSVLIGTRVLGIPFSAFRGWSIDAESNNGNVDYVKMYDSTGKLVYDEEFANCAQPVTPAFPLVSPPDVFPANFQQYFNQKFGTNYSFGQIDTLYMTSCGRHASLCGETVLPVVNLAGPMLCGKAPVNIPVSNYQYSPCDDTTNFAITLATDMYNSYTDSLQGAFKNAYLQKCLNAVNLESFTVSHNVSEYHYTLYYYDQAGNLVKTVPPEGVHPNRDPAWLSQVAQARAAGQVIVPNHTIPTIYRYNTLNQVVNQQTPDAGLSFFWYDRLGRLVISQNAKQATQVSLTQAPQTAPSQVAVQQSAGASSAATTPSYYSYTLYDYLGRITEVGQKQQTTPMLASISRSQASLANWLSYVYSISSGKVISEQATQTVYDLQSPVVQLYSLFTQQPYTLRNRVSYTRYYDNLPVVKSASVFISQYGSYTSGTNYCYDIHGNVDTLLQDYRLGLMAAHGNNRFKLIAYKYDLISGKVNQVHYQPDQVDALYHRYEYDAENRITDVYTTSSRGLIGYGDGVEEHEAFYQYYKHGPLARAVIGQQQVQGLDYAYTLQGWLKGVNSTSLSPNFDMGADGVNGGTNTQVAADAFGYNLNYFTGDYSAINAAVSPFPGFSANLPRGAYNPLYNGNISSMAVNISNFNQPLLYNYQYDQLNRLVSMDAYSGLNQVKNTWKTGLSPMNDYQERASYDANGNILTYSRNSTTSARGGIPMDNLTYQYERNTNGQLTSNKLRYVYDGVQGNAYTGDIKTQTTLNLGQVQADNNPGQGSDNYAYDAIGNLIKDNQAGITNINWNVYGKIQEIDKPSDPSTTQINYTYDAAGNRISKIAVTNGVNNYTWYVRDASGNVMAVYSYTGNNQTRNTLSLTEHHLYGSSRLGVWNRNINADALPSSGTNANLIGATFSSNFERGDKLFELSNHLGNVLVTVSDKKLGILSNNGQRYTSYTADVKTAQDYYPFGMMQPGRQFTAASSNYRYGFNGQEKSTEIDPNGNLNTAQFWEYDSRIGRRWNLDPKSAIGISEYVAFNNNPIWFSDPLGDTLTNPQLVDALKIASKEIKGRLKTDQGFFNEGAVKSLGKEIAEYAQKNKLSNSDVGDFYKATHQYYNGLGTLAQVSPLNFFELDNQVLNDKNTNSRSIVMASEYFIHAGAKEFGHIWTEAYKRTLETVFAAGLPISAGKGPRGILITPQTQEALVNAGYRQSFVGDYFLFSKSNFSSGVFRKEIWALAYTGEGKSGGTAILQVLKSIETEARAAGARTLIISGKQVVNESILGLSSKTAATLGYDLQKTGKDVITLTKKF